MHKPQDSPAFRLVKAGYDVWLGNSRGSKYSLQHLNYDEKIDLEYWNFSFVEFGKYDLSASVDYIL